MKAGDAKAGSAKAGSAKAFRKKGRDVYKRQMIERDKLLKSVRFNVLTKKLMEHFQCNAFTAQCKECCATTRLNHEQVTFCLGHALNNELGIPSALSLIHI